MAVNLTDVLNGEDESTVENIALGVAYAKAIIDTQLLLRVPKTGIQDTENWSGTAYTDPDAVGANPTAKIYPDGTIIGSTDNGKYIKYPNGRIICYGTASVTTTGANLWATATDTLSHELTTVYGTNESLNATVSNQLQGTASTSAGVSVNVWMISASSGITQDIDYMVYGEWK